VVSFCLLFLLVYSQWSQIACLPYFHTWCGLSANLECRFEMCFSRLAGNTGRRNSQSHHRTTLSGYIFTTKACIDNWKKLLNSNISSTCPHDVMNFGPLTAEISWRVWGTPANFNRFHILASLLHRRCSTEVNKTLHDVWPSPGLVQYIYIFRSFCPLTEFCQVQNSLCVQVLHSAILPALLEIGHMSCCRRCHGAELWPACYRLLWSSESQRWSTKVAGCE